MLQEAGETMFPGPWMRFGRKGRFFERGALRFLILDLLSEKPRHGYDVIRELEDRSGGYYSPSPGTVYPTLQLLEDQGYVKVREEEGKKVYQLSDEGEAYVTEHKERVAKHRERMSEVWPPAGKKEGAELLFELKGIFHGIAHAAWRSLDDPEKLKAIREVLRKTKEEVDEITKGQTV